MGNTDTRGRGNTDTCIAQMQSVFFFRKLTSLICLFPCMNVIGWNNQPLTFSIDSYRLNISPLLVLKFIGHPNLISCSWDFLHLMGFFFVFFLINTTFTLPFSYSVVTYLPLYKSLLFSFQRFFSSKFWFAKKKVIASRKLTQNN